MVVFRSQGRLRCVRSANGSVLEPIPFILSAIKTGSLNIIAISSTNTGFQMDYFSKLFI